MEFEKCGTFGYLYPCNLETGKIFNDTRRDWRSRFDDFSPPLFPSSLPPPRREGYCRELCSRKMHLRFEGQEQIEETLVANEDKHGGGREKL